MSKQTIDFCLPCYQLGEAAEIRAREQRDQLGSNSVTKWTPGVCQGEMNLRVMKGNQLQASSLYLSEPKNRHITPRAGRGSGFVEGDACVCESECSLE